MKSSRGSQKKRQVPAATLPRNEIFDVLSTQELSRLLGLVERVELPKHHVIFTDGSESSFIYFVESGSVRITRPSPDGKSFVILALLGPGDMVGDAAWESGVYDSSAETLEDTVLCALARDKFVAFVREHPSFALRLIHTLGIRLKQSHSRIEDLVFRQVPSRVARLFVNLAEHHGKMTSHGVILEMPLTHQEIADLVGSSRVTVTHVLNHFRSNQWVGIKKKRVTIHDMMALEDLIASDANPRKRSSRENRQFTGES